MSDFFNRLGNHLAKATNVELISIHIPKTAGTAFFHNLKEAYPEESVIRLDSNQRKEVININNAPLSDTNSFAPAKVIHGHFTARILNKTAPDLLQRTPVITWLRDPVERIVSNYTYMAKRIAEELDEEGKGLNILSKMQRNLLEYARLKSSRNLQTRYLKGLNIDDLFFVGIQAHYAADLAELGRLLDWPEIKVRKRNVTNLSYELSLEEREEIEALNQPDIEFYREALAIRAERLRTRSK